MDSLPPDDEIMGLYVWVPGSTGPGIEGPSIDESIDIIAVQGLGASPYYTWVKKIPKAPGSQEMLEVMWLRDLLPDYVKNARIATFSYLSDWYTYRRGVRTSLHELGEQLLNALHQDRQKVNAARRPILFIGHSMGGLVIKQALVLASNRGHGEDIKRSTAGIVFLGTPHGGTDVAGYGRFIAKLKRNDPSLVESLKPTDKGLYDLSIDFAAGYENLPIMCFYEKVPTNYARGLTQVLGRFAKLDVVEQRSAVREGKKMIYLVTDHSGLNKYSGHDDPNFKLVCIAIDQMAKNASQVARRNFEGSKQIEATIVIPFERDEDFIGRKDVLEKVDQTLSRAKSLRRVALEGLGGVGKSQIAIEYAYRVRNKAPQSWVFWVHASNSARFEQSYRAIALAAKLPGAHDPKIDTLSLVFRWLESDGSGDWLMVLDNADDASIFFTRNATQEPQRSDQREGMAVLTSYLPRSSRGSILITTRSRNAAFRLAGKEERIFKVESMGEADAKSLLRKKLPKDRSDEKDWTDLVGALEFLPLAITQAAAYIAVKAPRITVTKYLEYFRRSEGAQISLLSEDGGDLRRDPEVPNSVVITWQISFDQIKMHNAPAADLLSRMCVLDRQGIPGFLFYDNDSDLLDFEGAIGTLIEFSFIASEKDETNFSIHRLVQLSTRKWLEVHGEIEQRRKEALSLLSAKFPNGEHAHWRLCEALEPHAQSVLQFDYTIPHCRLERAQILHNSAWYGWARGKYQVSQDRVQEAFKIREKLLERDDPDTLGSLSLLALVLTYRGQWKDAEELQVQVMETSLRVLGAEHPSTLTSMANLASTYRNQGRWKEAEELDVQVMETRKRVLGAEHPSTLTSMANLASTFWNQGRWKEAEELDVQVMETRKRVLGAEHPSTLTSMANLASTFWNQGRWKEAEELGVQVMETRKRVLGAEHPDTLTSMANLASTFWNQGRWKEAEELEVQVMETRKRVLGAEHPDTLTSMANLASTFWNQGRWKEAEELEVQVMETRKRVLGAEHPDTLTSMANLASTFWNQGRWKEAEELEVQVMETRKRVLGAEHPSTLTSMANLASTFWNQGRWKEAEELGVQVMETRKRVLGAEHPDTLTSMANLASTFWNQGRWKEAEELEVQVMETRKRVLGAEHPSTLTNMNNLAHTWKLQGRGQEASILMAECVQLHRKKLGVDHPNTKAAIQTLKTWRQ